MKLFESFGFSVKELIIGITLFGLVFAGTFISRTFRILKEDAFFSKNGTSVYLYEDSSLEDLISVLNTASVDFDEQELKWVSRLLGWRTFRKGHYRIEDKYSYDGFLSELAFGSQTPVDVTILPGITLERFSRDLGNQLMIDSASVIATFNDSTFISELNLSRERVFGRMLPETYKMYWTSSSQAVIKKVLSEFDKMVTNPFSSRIDSLDRTIDEIITMASIVEWEANIEEEKPVVAGLYWNRLKRRMHLQADPTISFALGERRRLLLEDYKIEHPYNTYMNYGLPPGPVTNPSLKTIEATLYPETHNYLYMVASPEGGHVFNRTYQEHLVDAEKWRKWLRQQYRIKRANERNGL